MSHKANDIIADILDDVLAENQAKIEEIAFLQEANEYIGRLKAENRLLREQLKAHQDYES